MERLRLPAIFLFGLLLSGFVLLEVVEVCLTLHGDGVFLHPKIENETGRTFSQVG